MTWAPVPRHHHYVSMHEPILRIVVRPERLAVLDVTSLQVLVVMDRGRERREQPSTSVCHSSFSHRLAHSPLIPSPLGELYLSQSKASDPVSRCNQCCIELSQMGGSERSWRSRLHARTSHSIEWRGIESLFSSLLSSIRTAYSVHSLPRQCFVCPSFAMDNESHAPVMKQW